MHVTVLTCFFFRSEHRIKTYKFVITLSVQFKYHTLFNYHESVFPCLKESIRPPLHVAIHEVSGISISVYSAILSVVLSVSVGMLVCSGCCSTL